MNNHSARIVYVVNDLALGGAQRVLLGQASRLDRGTFEPAVASLELDPCGALAPAFADAGIPVWRLRREGEAPALAVPRLIARLAKQRPAIVHTHLAAAGVTGRLAAYGLGRTRVVTTLHNLSDWQERAGDPLRWLDRATLPIADAVVTVSDAVRAACLGRCPRLGPRTVTIRNGIDVPAFDVSWPERDEARARLGYGRDDVVVGAVSRLEPRKGIDVLVRAVAAARPDAGALRLHIVGDGPERAALEQLAVANGIAGVTRFTGHAVDVRAHLAAFDLFAAPSRSEGLGIAIIEALAAGVPALGAEVGGIPELLSGASCGCLLPPEDVAAWREALVAFALAEDIRLAMAREAPAWAAQFSLDAGVEALSALYARLLAWPARAPVADEARAA